MRISQLSETTGVPVPTIKYYLREKLLPEGERVSATQSDYGDAHVSRLGVIRALGDAGVPIAGIRRVVAALDSPPEEPYDLLGTAHAALAPPPGPVAHSPAADEIVARLGGDASTCLPDQIAAVAGALGTLERAGFTVPPAVMDAYIAGLGAMARAELAGTPQDSAEAAVRYVVLGTALVEPLLLAMRRIAQQVAAAEQFGVPRDAGASEAPPSLNA